MTFEDFMVKITSTYRDDKNQDVNDTFRSMLLDFDSRVSISDYSGLYDFVCQNYQYKNPPKPFLFWKYAKENGYISDTRESGNWWRVCDNGHKYMDCGSSCPVCGDHNFSLEHGDLIPADVIDVQESCSECSWYEKSLSGDTFGLYGPGCNQYGAHDRLKERKYCDRCKCRDCCELSYLSKYNQDMYRERYGDLIMGRFEKLKDHIGELHNENKEKFQSKRVGFEEYKNSKI